MQLATLLLVTEGKSIPINGTETENLSTGNRQIRSTNDMNVQVENSLSKRSLCQWEYKRTQNGRYLNATLTSESESECTKLSNKYKCIAIVYCYANNGSRNHSRDGCVAVGFTCSEQAEQ